MTPLLLDHLRKTALVFGDGAGCCLLSYSKKENQIIDVVCSLDSLNLYSVIIPNGGSAKPINKEVFEEQNHFLRFTNKQVFEIGIQLFIKGINENLTKNNIGINDIDLIIPHQANKRMIEELARRLGVSIEKFYINIEHIGNTGAATIPIALSQLKQRRKLKGKMLLASVGAGFTYASTILNF